MRKPSVLLDEVILAVYLVALDRVGEALQILTFLGHHFEYKDDLEQWEPVALGICVQSRLLRQADRAELAHKAMQKVATHPFLTASSEEIANLVGSASEKLTHAMADHSIKAACRRSGETLLHLMAFEEMRRYDKALFTGFEPEQVEEIIEEFVQKLRGRLQR